MRGVAVAFAAFGAPVLGVFLVVVLAFAAVFAMLILCLMRVLWPEVEAMGADVVRDGFRNESCEVFTGACAPPDVCRGNVGSVGFDQYHARCC
jgi:hypothetical protein